MELEVHGLLEKKIKENMDASLYSPRNLVQSPNNANNLTASSATVKEIVLDDHYEEENVRHTYIYHNFV